METSLPAYKKYLFVCENSREEGRCCAPDGNRLRELLKQSAKEKGLAGRVRVSRAGCLDSCAEGPNVLLMPDNVWFKRVRENDVEAILRRAAEGL
ncbi:MAG TPA: (2Fe-2S) ferredoxin domain-containing protein [Candidatus Eisenbacteria bacterium]|nr:(2Fe-2S) ferredoxin domain-containing protein [Candidatus Eisenbacteria bacterium]